MERRQVAELAEGILRGDRLSVARAISLVEGQPAGQRQAMAGQEPAMAGQEPAVALLSALYAHTGQAHLIGVTGSAGTGKSTLVNQLARAYRQREERVGIIAVDPSSPLSGGALLGDRIRMAELAGDPGVFIRSMATRGAWGGLARATSDAVHILDAAGYTVILVETVGAGQDEVEIARTAHTIVVVEAPGLGDDIQALKSGLIEIADILVVNKADREGADQAVRALEMMLEIGDASRPRPADGQCAAWRAPVCRTVALDGAGVAELVSQVDAHRRYLESSGRRREKEFQRTRAELESLLRQALFERFVSGLEPGRLDDLVSRLVSRQVAPLEVVTQLLPGSWE